ncbi:ribonuclease HII [Sabulilitoribacter arenilitoris]|uniref:Ribonuclease HII n=1 Tax=Wocania arenilitoris TaxID=2044858 RepID=A0AAE3EPK8_9FLAO|nr:ribonuclease HII [Wocania arenilitoris]MCF7567720.1 ribonuclease HII [Wocania arenilitoris]
MRFFCFALLLLTLSCSNQNTTRTKFIHFIPENTSVVVKTSNIESLKSAIQNNDLIEKLSNTNTYNDIKNKLDALSILDPKSELLICFSKENNDSLQYSIITKYHTSLFKTDSLTNYIEEKLTYKNKSITKSTLNNNIFYSTAIDSVFFASSSKKIIDAAFLNTEKKVELEKIYNTTDKDKSLSVLINSENEIIKSFFIEDLISLKNFSNYYAVDADISQDEMIINGITKASDSTNSLINIFKNNIPQENQIQNITPSNSDGFLSFTFNDYKTFKTNLLKFNKQDSIVPTTLFDNAIEIGVVYEGKKQAIVLNSIDVIATKDALLSELNISDTYRQIDIYSFSKANLFSNTFSPLINFNKASKYCVIDNFFVFADSLEMLQNIIASYQNKTTLSEQTHFKDIKANLSDESSLLIIVNSSILKTILDKNLKDNSNYNLKKYNASGLQFIYDINFAHINGIIKKAKTRGYQNSISEEFNIKLDANLLNQPQFVINHITKQKEIVVQDVNNKLYLISNRGKILWKKQLQGAVLGNIEQIDIYKNGRLQLAFATANKIYIIDRNGNDVAPFPKKFSNNITQPLSVFDYDKNKNYRLLVTQNKKLFMYNVSGKIVNGFTFKSANNNINTQPKHFRMNGKDYLTFKTANKLYILDRTGKTRVKPKTSNNFSNEAIHLYKNKFTTTTQNGDLVSIDSRGNTTIENLNLSNNHQLETTSKTLVTLKDNKLTIKSKTIELDFGNYSPPKIFYINDKIYVSVVDLQSQKIHLFDSQAKPIANFPVYGNSQIDMDNIDKDKNLEFVTKGESNAVILYQMN